MNRTKKNLSGQMNCKLIICVLISTLLFTLPACKTTQEKQAAKIEKEAAKKKEQAEKDYEKAQKRHMKIQDKKTRKRMKKNKSKMMGETSVKKRSCWQRFFHPKKEKTCNKVVTPGI